MSNLYGLVGYQGFPSDGLQHLMIMFPRAKTSRPPSIFSYIRLDASQRSSTGLPIPQGCLRGRVEIDWDWVEVVGFRMISTVQWLIHIAIGLWYLIRVGFIMDGKFITPSTSISRLPRLMALTSGEENLRSVLAVCLNSDMVKVRAPPL